MLSFQTKMYIGTVVTIAIVVLIFFVFGRKEKFVFTSSPTTPDQYLAAYKSIISSPSVTTTLPVVPINDIPNMIAPYYNSDVYPTRNKIYVIDITALFNGQAYSNFSQLVKCWPSVVNVKSPTTGAFEYQQAPYPTGRAQIIPFQNNRTIVVDTNTQNADAFTFDCTNKAQAALVRQLLINDGAISSNQEEQANHATWVQQEQLMIAEDMANYHHGYNTGYVLGMVNSCGTDPSGTGSSGSDGIMDSILGYSGDGASAVGFGMAAFL